MGAGDRVTVIIPWQPGCPHRTSALGWVLDQWEATGHQVLLGWLEDQPWCKAAAVANALPRVVGDVLVVADADVWSPGTSAAIEAVRAGAAWAMPHGRVHRLTPESTARVLAGTAPTPGDRLVQAAYRGWPGGGTVVLPTSTYRAVPLDPRFVGWGGEDESWARALDLLAGPGWRGTAPLYHLWHPPQKRMSRRWGSPEAKALAGRYRAASTPQAMRDLINETEEAAWQR